MTVQFFRAEDPDRPRGPRWRTAAGAVVVLLVVLAGSAVAATALSAGHGSGEVVEVADGDGAGSGAGDGRGDGDAPSGRSPELRGTPGTGGTVFVHVLGQVVVPGLYEVAADARLVDVVAAAGGFTPEADQGGVNLARTLTDGEQVRVPAVGEVVPVPPGAPGGAGASAGADGAGGAGASGGLVPLGTATAEQLETLPGVGPATSAAILTWRDENGGFRSVDDLLEVPGIGEKTLEKLRPLVTP